MSARKWKTDPVLWAKVQPLAQQMRHEPTPAENVLWKQLRNHQLGGLRFRRQHTIARFVADFYCAEARLVVEVDGSIHDFQGDADEIRDEFMRSLGLRVMRFTNDQVMASLDIVLQQIVLAAHRSDSPSP